MRRALILAVGTALVLSACSQPTVTETPELNPGDINRAVEYLKVTSPADGITSLESPEDATINGQSAKTRSIVLKTTSKTGRGVDSWSAEVVDPNGDTKTLRWAGLREGDEVEKLSLLVAPGDYLASNENDAAELLFEDVRVLRKAAVPINGTSADMRQAVLNAIKYLEEAPPSSVVVRGQRWSPSIVLIADPQGKSGNETGWRAVVILPGGSAKVLTWNRDEGGRGAETLSNLVHPGDYIVSRENANDEVRASQVEVRTVAIRVPRS